MSAQPAMSANPSPEPQPLLVYGVVRAPGDRDDRDARGDLDDLDGNAAELVSAADIAAVVCAVAPDVVRVRRADLLAYHSVLDALAARGPVVPVRFGSVLPGRDAVAEFLAQHCEQLTAALDRLTGRRQYNLRVSYVEEVVLAELVAEDPEIRDLRARIASVPDDASYPDRVRLGELVARSLENWSERDAEALLAAVEPDVVAYQVRSAPSATQVLDVALLVDDARAEQVVDHLEELARQNHETLRMRLVGPLAAHDFAEETPWD